MKKFVVFCLGVFLVSLPLQRVFPGGGQQKAAGGKTVVTFQTWNPGAENIAEIEKTFESKNPDIDLEFVFVPYTDHIQKLKIDLAAGEGPDVFGLQIGASIAEFHSFLTELTPYAQKEWSNWPADVSSFAQSLLSEQGKYYGMPLGITYAGLMWADRLWLSKYGLSIPKNIDELRNVSKVLRSKGDLPVVIGAKDDWINLDTWMNIANDINPAKLYAAIDGKTAFTDPDIIESFRIWQLLFTESIVQDGALGVNMYNDTTDLFHTEGKVPVFFNGSWEIGSFLSPTQVIYRTFNDGAHEFVPFRMDWNNDGKAAPLTSSIDVVLCLNKNSKNPEAAWRFIAFLIQEGQTYLINQLQYFPSLSTIQFTAPISDLGRQAFDAVVDWGQNNVAGYRENPYPELKQAIADNLKALALNQVTPAQAAAALERVSKSTKR
jgi:ABC-type glycerol-3-phosphate transport system substrate-binding protein